MSGVQYKCCISCGFILCQVIQDQRGHLRAQEFHVSMDEDLLTCTCGQKYRRYHVADGRLCYDPIQEKKAAGD
jgi:imidazoleglycerol phosphate dehydratase HisB